MIANARMYAVTPETEALWRDLLAHVAAEAGVDMVYEPYPAPQPLERLWSRPDLGAVFMCGYPIALAMAEIVPIAGPIPTLDWAEGRSCYRTDLIVRADAPFRTLADTFGTRIGWTVDHSQSGFNALRHHLLAYRTAERPNLYAASIGPLVTARAVLDAVLDGRIDIGPLDAYWHALMAEARPDLAARVRVIEVTALTPMPAFVASPALGANRIACLREAFVQARLRPWFAALANPLKLAGFAPVDRLAFQVTLDWRDRALAAGYPVPA